MNKSKLPTPKFLALMEVNHKRFEAFRKRRQVQRFGIAVRDFIKKKYFTKNDKK